MQELSQSQPATPDATVPPAALRGGIPKFSDEDVAKMLATGEGRNALRQLAIIQAMNDSSALDDLMRVAYSTEDPIRIAEAKQVRKMIRRRIRMRTGGSKHANQ